MRSLLALLLVAGCDQVFGQTFEPIDAAPDALPPGDWAAVEAAATFTCGLRSDRSLWCWGTSVDGALGLGDVREAIAPTRVGTGAWQAMSVMDRHACGIDGDGGLWCWGANEGGQLGVGTVSLLPTTAPVRVGSARWKAVAAGGSHACGIQADDTLWCWGKNALGQLGDNSFVDRAAPVPVAASTSWSSIATGADHSCGIQHDGTLWCWGGNIFGQLGQPVLGLALVPGQVGLDRWTQVSTGDRATCGVVADGRLRCWGLNDRGQLGLGTTTTEYRPRPVGNDANDWQSIDLGEDHACGVRTDGALWCWGDNEFDMIASDDVGRVVSSPVRIAGASLGWQRVATGERHTCVLGTDGNLWCAGNDGSGQLGIGTGGTRRAPTRVAGDLLAKELAIARTTSCIVATDDTLHCWGSDLYGSLGAELPLALDRPNPVITTGAWAGDRRRPVARPRGAHRAHLRDPRRSQRVVLGCERSGPAR